MKNKCSFDKEKAFYFRRRGVIAGGRFSMQITPSDVVECFEEIIPVNAFEDGMKDRGAHMYFAGKKEGTAIVTMFFHYPTCKPEELILKLKVDEHLRVDSVE